MSLGNERVTWFNGKIVRESEVMIPFRDQGFLRGDAVFDMTRSFNGKAFRIGEHVARLYRSLKYLDIDRMPRVKKLWWYGYGQSFARHMEGFVDLQFARGTGRRLRGALQSIGLLRVPKM